MFTVVKQRTAFKFSSLLCVCQNSWKTFFYFTYEILPLNAVSSFFLAHKDQSVTGRRFCQSSVQTLFIILFGIYAFRRYSLLTDLAYKEPSLADPRFAWRSPTVFFFSVVTRHLGVVHATFTFQKQELTRGWAEERSGLRRSAEDAQRRATEGKARAEEETAREVRRPRGYRCAFGLCLFSAAVSFVSYMYPTMREAFVLEDSLLSSRRSWGLTQTSFARRLIRNFLFARPVDTDGRRTPY